MNNYHNLTFEQKQQMISSSISDHGSLDRMIEIDINSQDWETLSFTIDIMKQNEIITFGYYAGSYVLGKMNHESDQTLLELLKELFEFSYDEKYMLEAAVLYCRTNQESKAKRMLKQMIQFFVQSEQVNEAKSILDLIEKEGAEKVSLHYQRLLFPVHTENHRFTNRTTEVVPASANIQSTEKIIKPVCKKEFPPEIEAEFCNLVGMDSVKEKLYEFYQMNWLAKERKEKLGLDVEDTKSYNFVLYGNPGTGKTTVARILGKLLCILGLRKSEKVIETDRSGIVGGYIGQTEEKMTKLLKEVKEDGATLFIDEAYTLYRKNNEKDFGIDAINCLLKDMEDNRGTYTVILAGYKKPMEEMLNEANPGFKSRFTYHINIPDYSNDELLEIAGKIAKKQKFVLSDDAKSAIIKRVERERVDETFANARFIRDLMNEAQMKMAIRVSELENKDINDLMILKAIDFGINESQLQDDTVEMLMNDLNSLIGLENVKKKVQSIVNSIRVKQAAEKRGLNLGDNIGTLHMVFKGSAGTGKTTVARIIGSIYKELGILKRGDVFIECTRSELVGSYQGHTAEKVKNKIKEAMGGILFIDEAYSLCRDENDTFGQEAVDALVADIENFRDKLMVIIAGYSEDMDKFLKKNQGLSSRMSTEIIFEDYSVDEMVDIMFMMIKSRNRILPEILRGSAYELCLKTSQKSDFGNARDIRNLVDKIIHMLDSRIASKIDNGEKLTKEDFITINRQDLELG